MPRGPKVTNSFPLLLTFCVRREILFYFFVLNSLAAVAAGALRHSLFLSVGILSPNNMRGAGTPFTTSHCAAGFEFVQ